MELDERARKVKLLLMDCDGVLTDGRLYFSERGETLKVFHVRDGQGIVDWHKAGFQSGIISGRGAQEILRSRADELGMKYLKTSSSDKGADLSEILSETGIRPDEVAYIGDDIGDIGVMKLVGFAVAVADASTAAKQAAIFVTDAPGGSGAVREVTDLLLGAKRS